MRKAKRATAAQDNSYLLPFEVDRLRVLHLGSKTDTRTQQCACYEQQNTINTFLHQPPYLKNEIHSTIRKMEGNINRDALSIRLARVKRPAFAITDVPTACNRVAKTIRVEASIK